MNDIAFAWGIGAVCGSRSMLGPALVANTLAPGPARGLTKIVAAVEMLADKSAHVGARTDALPLTGRLATGALSAAACAAPGRRRRIERRRAGDGHGRTAPAAPVRRTGVLARRLL